MSDGSEESAARSVAAGRGEVHRCITVSRWAAFFTLVLFAESVFPAQKGDVPGVVSVVAGAVSIGGFLLARLEDRAMTILGHVLEAEAAGRVGDLAVASAHCRQIDAVRGFRPVSVRRDSWR